MGSYLRNKLQDLILVGSPRVGFHPAIPYHRQGLHPLIKEHAQYISCDRAIVNGLIICKICHQIFTHARWNKKVILKHFQQIHQLPTPEHPTPHSPLNHKLENAKANISPEPIIATAIQSKEENEPVPYELIVIDDDVSTSAQPKIPETNPPAKKKRGRKPKIRPFGAPALAKKKIAKCDGKKVRKKRDSKMKILTIDEAAFNECTCSPKLS